MMRRDLPSMQPSGRRAPHDVLQIAHRGGNHGAEDYRAGNLRRIAALGAHLVEIDIRSTADRRLVVHHDPDVVVDGVHVPVRDLSLRDLDLPEAGTVLRSAHEASLGVYVDIKHATTALIHDLATTLAGEGMTGRAILASDDPDIVAACAAAVPGIPRAVLFRAVDEDPVPLARAARATFVHPCWEQHDSPAGLLAGAWLDTVRRHGLGVITWHEERPDILRQLLTLGVDGICTDEPALLARLLTAPYAQPPSETATS